MHVGSCASAPSLSSGSVMLSREQLSATAQQRVSARQSDVMVTARGSFEFEYAREALCEARDNRLVLAPQFTRL